jgi:glucose-1-phosphate thymidylyltransferase
MKGVILAGGLGTRMGECTKVINKTLLPVYDKPMIYYPLNTLRNSGITEILIIVGGPEFGEIMKLLEDGSSLGVDITYKVQKTAHGTAHALFLAKDFVKNDSVVVLLGDNYFEDNFINELKEFDKGAMIFLKETNHPQRFGIAETKDNKVISIEEKPKNPKSNLAVTGLYVYDNKVFDIIKNIKPSARGELEITDVNNAYIRNNEMSFSMINDYWGDMGEPDSLLETAYFLYNKNKLIE